MIYSYLLEPKPQFAAGPVPYPGSTQWDISNGVVGCGRVLLQCNAGDNSLRPMRAYGYSYPDLQVMQLCKTIRDEATQFFYNKHHFEVFVGLGHEAFMPGPSTNFRMDFVKDLR